MRWLPGRWRSAAQDLSDELNAHLRLAVEERIANGEDPAEARRTALYELGNIALIQDVTRQTHGWLWLENILRDLRLALRHLYRSPGFTLTVVLTLALGIGANLAVFQLLYRAVLADLPVPRPQELFALQAAPTPFDHSWLTSYAAFKRLQAATDTSSRLAAHTALGQAILQQPGQNAARARYELVSDNYFQVLGVPPCMGRPLLAADATASGGEWAAIARYDFARDTFGDPGHALGRHIRLNGVDVVIVGVADSRFLGIVPGYPPDLWLPLEAQGTGHLFVGFDSLGSGHAIELSKPWHSQDGIFWLALLARVPKPARALAAQQWSAAFQSDRLLMATATADPVARASVTHGRVQLIPAAHGQGGIRNAYAAPLTLLMALSASVFLVGCLNLANIQIARLSVREREFALRAALGAGRWRLLRQVMVEMSLLVLAGGILAFLVGRAASTALVHWTSSRGWPLQLDMHLNLPLAALGVSLMLASLATFCMLPALQLTRAGLAGVAGSRARVTGPVQGRLGRLRADAMLALQAALSLLLATMAGYFAATLTHWQHLDVGMDREHILSIHLDMERTGYAARHERDLLAIGQQIKARLLSITGVRSAALGMCSIPDCGWNTALYVFGRSTLSDAQAHGEEDHVGPGYFQTMAIPLLRGRDFSTADTEHTQSTVILNKAYTHQLFGDADPVGHWVGYEPAPHDHHFLVIGEVDDARVDGARSAPPPVAYMSIQQNPAPIHTIHVRVAGDPGSFTAPVRAALRQIDPDLPVGDITTLSDALNDGLGTERLLARLAATYAALTLLLVAIGFYGVLSFRTSRRRTEFGIRLALGATRSNIHLLVLVQTVRILIAGIPAGILLSIVALRLAGHILHGSVISSGLTTAAATAILAAIGFTASFLPARRAALTHPMESLRQE